MGLWINDSGATDDEISNAVYWAHRYFVEKDLVPEYIWNGFQRDSVPATKAWGEAEMEAFKRLFAGWNEWPESASLIYE